MKWMGGGCDVVIWLFGTIWFLVVDHGWEIGMYECIRECVCCIMRVRCTYVQILIESFLFLFSFSVNRVGLNLDERRVVSTGIIVFEGN